MTPPGAVADEHPARRRPQYAKPVAVQAQAHAREPVLDRTRQLAQPAAVFAEQDEIVKVAHITTNPKATGEPVIERAQISVGESLTRQVADRQAMPARQRGEQVVAGEPFEHFLLRIGTIDDAAQ
jgi:hypothetical protein